METEIYTNNGENKEIIQLCVGSSLKYNKNVDNIIENYHTKVLADNDSAYINDKSLEEVLNSYYFNFGIIPKILLKDNSIEKDYVLSTKIEKQLLPQLSSINLPNILIAKINNYIDICHTYLDIIFKNYEDLSRLENNLINKLDVYRNKYLNRNSTTYIIKVMFFNRIKIFINELKHEKIIDFQYCYSNLLKFKYFTLIVQKDVITIHEQLLVFDDLLKNCQEPIEFLDEHSEKKFYEIRNGSIKIDEIKMLLEKYIDDF